MSKVAFSFVLLLGFFFVSPLAEGERDWSRFRAGKKAKTKETEYRAQIRPAQMFVKKGGRVSWYRHKAQNHQLIAYDSVVGRRTEVFTIKPDGSAKQCVTCNSSLPKGFVGQPEWHPDGDHILVQVESPNSQHSLFNHLSWGLDNDLWLVRRDGSGAERIWNAPLYGAALHPHFDDSGRRIVFAERVPTGRSSPLLRGITPGGEVQWEGWRIHIADFSLNGNGTAKLSNHKTSTPNGPGFYETHGFAPDGRIVYSFTPLRRGNYYIDDVYTANPDGSGVSNMTNSPSTWDEHGQFSPDGRIFAWVSSRFDPSIAFPGTRAKDLRMEMFIREGAGPPTQITEMNKVRDKQSVVSDFDWDRTGTRIVCEVGGMADSEGPELWIISMR